MSEDHEIKPAGSTELFRMQHLMYYEEGVPQPTIKEVQESRAQLLDRIQSLIYGDEASASGSGCVDFRTAADELVLIDDVSDETGRKFRVTIEKNNELTGDNVILLSDNDVSLGDEMFAFTNVTRDQILLRLIDLSVGPVEEAEYFQEED